VSGIVATAILIFDPLLTFSSRGDVSTVVDARAVPLLRIENPVDFAPPRQTD